MASKDVRDIVPGDKVPYTRTVTETRRTDATVTLTYDDGTTASFDLANLPAVDVLALDEVVTVTTIVVAQPAAPVAPIA